MKLFWERQIFVVVLFWIALLPLSAQESDFMKDIFNKTMKETIKESLKTEMQTNPEDVSPFLQTDSGVIELDVNKQPLAPMGFNYKQNSLYLHHKDSLPLEREWSISPNLTAAYTNSEKKFDPTSTETTGDIIANAFLRPIAAIVLLQPFELFNYLIQIGVLPGEPAKPKMNKHAKALKHITEDIYPVEEE